MPNPQDAISIEFFRTLVSSVEFSGLHERVTGTFDSSGNLLPDPQAGLDVGFIWVHSPDGRALSRAALSDRMTSIRRTAGKRCTCGYNRRGELFAIAPINDEQSAPANELASSATQQSTPIPAANVDGGRVLATTGGGLFVYVTALPEVGWLGGTLTIDSGDLPSSSGEFGWLVIYFTRYLGVALSPTYALTTPSTQPTKDTLPISDAFNLALPYGSIRLFAVGVYNGQTTIDYTESRFENIRRDWVPEGLLPSLATVSTTNATQTTIATIGTLSGISYTAQAIVTARRTGGSSGSAGDSAGYQLFGVFKNVAGTLSQIGTTVKGLGESQAGWDADFTISGTNLLISVTGAVNNNVDWTVSYTTQFI